MTVDFLVGLDTYSYHTAAAIWPPSPNDPMELPRYLTIAAALGLDGIASADMGHFSSTDDDSLGELRSTAGRLGLYVEIGTGGSSPDSLAEAARISRFFEQDVVRTFVSAGATWKGEFDAELPVIAEKLSRACDLAQDYGVTLAVENHQDLTSAELERLVDAVGGGRLGVCLDTGNPLGVLEDPIEAAARLAPYVHTVHLKDYCLVPFEDGYILVGCPIGEGSVPLGEIITLLREQAPTRALHLNIESALEFIPVCRRRGHAWSPRHADVARRMLSGKLRGFSLDELVGEAWFCRLDAQRSLEEMLAAEDMIVRRSVPKALKLARGD